MTVNIEKIAFRIFNTIGRPKVVSGFISNYGLDYRRFLLTLLPPHSLGAEIGVWKGEFSERLFYATAPKELHLIDPWVDAERPGHIPDEWMADQDGRNEQYQRVKKRFSGIRNVYIHRGYSGTVLETFPDNYFDWVYVDGDHSYEGVKVDLELCLKKVKPAGLICGDDYSLNGWWKDGVIRAVNEMIESGKAEVLRIQGRQYALINSK